MSAPASSPLPFPRLTEAGVGDVVTLAFADEQAGVHAYGRMALGEHGSTAHRLAALFVPGQPPVMVIDEPTAGTGLGLIERDGGWGATLTAGPGAAGSIDLDCEPLDPCGAITLDGVERHVQRLRLSGELRGAGDPIPLRGTGQLTYTRAADTPRAGVARDLCVWVQDRLTIDLHASRERQGDGHERERVLALVLDHDPPAVQAIEEARLSTTYAADGSPLRAGLELWADEESAYPRRAAGDALMTASLTTDGGRWDCAIMEWRIEGGTGIGPYALWRATPGRRR